MAISVIVQRQFVAITLIILSYLLNNSVYAQSGAVELPDNMRPSTTWDIAAFNGAPEIQVNGSIEAAINSCNLVAGNNNYCVVKIGANATRQPFTVSRSKTKIVGEFDRSTGTATTSISSIAGSATITIASNVSEVVLANLSIIGQNAGENYISGIDVKGQDISNIMIRDNLIQDFTSMRDAHAIAIFGVGGTQASRVHNIVIKDNEVFRMQTGTSESIVVNGNVESWVVDNNYLEDLNNIAIDAIGGEATSPKDTSGNRILPGILDAARYGWITNNAVIGMSTATNPGYGNEESWAAAIYVDGGRNILIENNSVENTPWAYDIGAENCLTSSNVIIRNNTATGSFYGDMLVGGYAVGGYKNDNSIDCDPTVSTDNNEGHGYVDSVTIEGNSFNSTGSVLYPQIVVQNRVTNSLIVPNNTPPIATDSRHLTFFPYTANGEDASEIQVWRSPQWYETNDINCSLNEGPYQTANCGISEPVDANSVLQNGGFEANLNNWNSCADIGSTQIVSDSAQGSSAVRITGGDCLYQEFTAIAGTTYTLSCQATSDLAQFSSVSLTMMNSAYESLLLEQTTVSSSSYQTFNTVITAPANTQIGAVTLYSEDNTVFDNCSVVFSTNPPVQPSLIQNGGFESSLSDWNSCSNTGITQIVSDSVQGSNAIQISGGDCVYQEFDVTAGANYSLSCDAKSAQTQYTSMALTMSNSGYEQLASQQKAVTSSNYQSYSVQATAPGGSTIGSVTLYSEDTGLIDNCRVVQQ